MRLGVQFEQLDGVIKGKEGSFDLKVRFEQYVCNRILSKLFNRNSGRVGEGYDCVRLKFYFYTVITSIYRVCTAMRGSRVLRSKEEAAR